MPDHARPGVLASDTSAAAEEVQVGRWRMLTGGEKLQILAALSDAVEQMALAGIAARFPQASPRERFLRLAILKLGADLAVRAYPDAAPYTDPS